MFSDIIRGGDGGGGSVSATFCRWLKFLAVNLMVILRTKTNIVNSGPWDL